MVQSSPPRSQHQGTYLVSLVCRAKLVAKMADDQSASNDSPELWRHLAPKETQIYAFQQLVKQRHNLTSNTYQDLWKWSVDHPAAFWKEIWHQTGIRASKPYEKVQGQM